MIYNSLSRDRPEYSPVADGLRAFCASVTARRRGGHSGDGLMPQSTCHPGRTAYRLGLCRPCYEKCLLDRQLPATCHPEKNNYFGGMCQECYRKSKQKKATCHPDRLAWAKGLCRECYDRSRPSTKRRSSCHPKRAEYRQGLCIKCYRKLKKANRPRAKCHPDEPEAFLGLCVTCYGKYRRNRQPRATCHPEKPSHGLSGFCSGCNRRYLRFNMTPDDFEAILQLQHGRCAICGCVPQDQLNRSRESFCVDHNHQTGEARGLLCVSCNAGIGQLQESQELLQRAIKYLANPTISAGTQFRKQMGKKRKTVTP